MAETPSTMLQLGTEAPDFSLIDAVSGRAMSLADFAGERALLVMFICNHCPFVVHVRGEFVRMQEDYGARGLAIVAINSNSIETHPQDGPRHMKELAGREGWRFPFLFDRTQEVARAYRAACTPDFFLFDSGRRLVYRGRLDASRPGNDVAVSGGELRAAVEAVLSGSPVSADQRPSIGCNIKWVTEA